MKKRILALVFASALFVMTICPANAMLRVTNVIPSLSFSGTTAICEVQIRGSHMSDSISATMKLWDGTTCIATWYSSGTGYLSMNKSKTVVRGKIYKLSVDATINGTRQSTMYVTQQC